MLVEKLLEQLVGVGMKFSGFDQVVISFEKVKFLGFFCCLYGKFEQVLEEFDQFVKKIMFNCWKQQEVMVNFGCSKMIVNVEVCQKCIYVKDGVCVMMLDEECVDILCKLEELCVCNFVEQQVLVEKDCLCDEVIVCVCEEEVVVKECVEVEKKVVEEVVVVVKVVEVLVVSKFKCVLIDEIVLCLLCVLVVVLVVLCGVLLLLLCNDDCNNCSVLCNECGLGDCFVGQMYLLVVDCVCCGNSNNSNLCGCLGGCNQFGGCCDMLCGGNNVGLYVFECLIVLVVCEVVIGEIIIVVDLVQKFVLKGGEVVKVLFKMGVMVIIIQFIDYDIVVLVIEEFGYKVICVNDNDVEDVLLVLIGENQGEVVQCLLVVIIMGYVDYGKILLLDYICCIKVVYGEVGGIIQYIGVYYVEMFKGVISFLDILGYVVFILMCVRGVKLIDIVVLVVVVDDGVMLQIKEVIQYVCLVGVLLIVVINKIDKFGVDLMWVKNELFFEQVVVEEFGGDIQMVEILVKIGLGIDDLLDVVLVQVELLELKVVDEGCVLGVVIELLLDKGRGLVVMVLVQQGCLKKGDYLVCGIQYGCVCVLFDEIGKQLEFVGLLILVQVLGLFGVLEVGDDFVVVEDECLVKDVVQQCEIKCCELCLVVIVGSCMEDIMVILGKGEGQQVFNLVIKVDVQGLVQVLSQVLVVLFNEDICINVIYFGVGGIIELDVNLVVVLKVIVIGFNVCVDVLVCCIIEFNGVDLCYFLIIYDVIDQVKQVVFGLLGVEICEEIIGIVEVCDVFCSFKLGVVVGLMVIEGVVKCNKLICVLCDSVVIFEGELELLCCFKENVEEVCNGIECGIVVKVYNDVKLGDQIECFECIEVLCIL